MPFIDKMLFDVMKCLSRNLYCVNKLDIGCNDNFIKNTSFIVSLIKQITFVQLKEEEKTGNLSC